MSCTTFEATSQRRPGAVLFKAQVFTALFSLVAFVLPFVLPCTSRAEPSYGVSVSASLFADFEASPTLNPGHPEVSGGNNVLMSADWLEQSTLSESFHEIYEGRGESGTSHFEVECDGYAGLTNGGQLNVDVQGYDQNNATASGWSVTGSAAYYQWLELSGPTDASGNYVITFTTNLGSFTAQNKQPPGFTYIWRANAGTFLVAEPLDTNFAALNLGTGVQLKEDCPTLAGPACWQIPRTTSSTGEVTVPGSNPVLVLSHSLSVTLRSAQANTGGASLSMQLPAGVLVTSYQPVPEPSLPLSQCGALLGLLALKRIRSKFRMAR